MSKRTFHKPDGAVRRSQVLTSGGPGAVVDLIDYAVVLRGLDSWKYESDSSGFLQEPRLEAQALRMLKTNGEWPRKYVRLRLPPRCEDDYEKAGPWRGMHAREFPLWYQCRNCRSLVRRDALNEQRRHTCYRSGEKTFPAVPIRFVGGCSAGHLQDISWRYFVHKGNVDEDARKPYLCQVDKENNRLTTEKGDKHTADIALISAGTSGDLSDLVVICRRCNATRSLQDLRAPGALGKCKAWRPWLDSNDASCDQQTRLLIRTGSNVWFPHQLSVLHLEEVDAELKKLISKHWDKLKKVTGTGALGFVFELMEDLERDFSGYPHARILELIEQRRLHLDGGHAPSIREVEWEALYNAEPGYVDDLPPRGEDWFAKKIDLELPDFIDRVVLVHALREVRALVGFTRIEGAVMGAEAEPRPDGQRLAPLSEDQDWIPAVDIRGEGVFIAFSEDKLRTWEDDDAVKAHVERFREGMRIENESRSPGRTHEVFTSGRLIMLHSLAHMLISQISLECGYSASAIRERIYCYRDADPAKSRAGILLYTGTPGSEGTLGGLVEVGADIVRHLRQAVARNLICSNDPVCAQHRPDGPEDGRRREGAACHGCLLIAEPSCERMNRDLDRTLVVPTLEDASAAFLRDWTPERENPI